jgi:hypothetical protein
MVRRSSRRTKQKGGKNKQNWEKNEGYFGKIMDKNGKLNRDEICHNCWPSGYAKEARRFCKIHDKVWDPKTNSCRKKKTKKQKGGRKRTLKNLTPEELDYFKSQPQHRRKRLLKDPCWPSIESPECVKLMVKDNPWMLEEGGDKYAQGVVGKKSPLLKEIKKKKKKKKKKAGTKPGTKSSKSTTIKYNKYSKCLEECKLKHKYSINKNKKHVCKDQCRIYKTIKIKTSKMDNKKKSSDIKPKKQMGGALCLPCIPPILSGLGAIGGGIVATGAATAGAMTMTSSKMSQSGDNIEREQSFEKKTSKTHKKSKKSKKSEEKLKFHITQKNNKVTYKRNNEKMKTKVFNKSKNMKDNINKATNFYNKKIEYCVVKGYKKC